jgi:hypothetical protein
MNPEFFTLFSTEQLVSASSRKRQQDHIQARNGQAERSALNLAQQATSNVHCFVDFSNFWVSLVLRLKENNNKMLAPFTPAFRPTCQLTFTTLANVLLSHFETKRVRSRVAIASVSAENDCFWEQLRSCGFDVNLYVRAQVTEAGHSKSQEVGVDNAIHAQIMARVLDRTQNPHSTMPTLILLTGDGNDNIEAGGVTDSFTATTNYPMCVELALQNGWRVIQYAWSWSCNATFKKMNQKHPFSKYQLIFLDSPELPFAAQFSLPPPSRSHPILWHSRPGPGPQGSHVPTVRHPIIWHRRPGPGPQGSHVPTVRQYQQKRSTSGNTNQPSLCTSICFLLLLVVCYAMTRIMRQ